MLDLETRETVRLSLRRVSGCRAVVHVGTFGRDQWWAAVDTGGPGIGSLSTVPSIERPLANRYNALLYGLVVMRNYWERAGVTALVRDLEEAIDSLE